MIEAAVGAAVVDPVGVADGVRGGGDDAMEAATAVVPPLPFDFDADCGVIRPV